MANEIQPFDYGEIESVTADKLKRHAAAIKGIQSKAIYEIGEELQAAHDELSNNRNGTFYAWCESIGIGRDTVKRILNYHSFISANCTNKELLESLPKSLVYEAARPSTPPELKEKVANGDITTLPEFKKLKAELEATKNVLRTTESKLTSAEQERDDAKTENVQLKANFSTAVSDKAFEIQGESVRAKKAAEQARDEAEAKAESFRAKADAYVDLQKTNHSLREKIRQQADELANRPNVETVVTKEVIPDEYKKAFMENQRMRKELATYKAHSQGQTLQELTQIDKEYADLEKSYDEEERACQRLEQFAMLPYFYPDGPIEARELVRCYMKFHGAEEAAVNSMIESIDHARDAMEWIGDALKNARKQMEKFDKALNRPALEVVK